MKRLLLAVGLAVIIAISGCSCSYLRIEYVSRRPPQKERPQLHGGTDIYYYGGRTRISMAPSKKEPKEKRVERRSTQRKRSATKKGRGKKRRQHKL